MTFDLDTRLEQGEATHKDVLEHLVSTYYKGVRHLALSLTRDSAEADDIAQKTMIKAAEKIAQYQPHSNLKAWVYKFAVNIAKTHIRKRATRQRIEAFLPFQRTTQTTPEDHALLSERDQKLWLAVQSLSDKHRLPVLMRYYHDLSTKQIAEMLDVPQGTVHSRIHYAERKLYGILTATEVTA